MIDLILAYRKLVKISSNNINALESLLSTPLNDVVFGSGTGTGSTLHDIRRIHAVWNQTVVRTGRLSCCKPNLQNIPNFETIMGMDVNVRRFFVASPGCVLVSADYSQIEMRVMAHVSQDRDLCRLFHNEGDVYKQLAAAVSGKPIDQIDKSERDKAKTVCLGVTYGMSHHTAAEKFGFDLHEFARTSKHFFDRFKGLKQWIDQTKASTKQRGFTRTIIGRRRYLPDINSSSRELVSQSERQAVNTVIQGSASDLIKMAMLQVEDALSSLRLSRPRPRILMQIHDEVIYEVGLSNPELASRGVGDCMLDGDLQSFVSLLKHIMEGSQLRLNVPTPINVSVGLNWGEMVPFLSIPPHHLSSVPSRPTQASLNPSIAPSHKRKDHEALSSSQQAAEVGMQLRSQHEDLQHQQSQKRMKRSVD